jgi:hypothetical protein
MPIDFFVKLEINFLADDFFHQIRKPRLYFYAPGPDLFLSGLFLRLKLGLLVGLAGAEGPVRPQAGLTQLATPILTLKNRSW